MHTCAVTYTHTCTYQAGRYRAIQQLRWVDFYVLNVACVKLGVRCASLLGAVALSASAQAAATHGEPPPLTLGLLLLTYVTALLVELEELTQQVGE